MDQALCRVVLWRHNNELPVWRVVPYTVGHPILLRDVSWLAATCAEELEPIIFEHFLYEDGEWTTATLQDGEVSVVAGSPIVLLRVHGVELCPLFGHELAAFDRNLGYYYDPAILLEINHRIGEPGAGRDIRVVAWTTGGQRPKIHRISFDDDNTIKLGSHHNLHVALGRRETVNLWIPGGEWEGRVSVHRPFWVEARYDSILVRLAGVGPTIGLGRELIALEPVGKVRRGARMVYVSLESYMGLARGVSPVYDIAVPAEIQARETLDRMQVLYARDEALDGALGAKRINGVDTEGGSDNGADALNEQGENADDTKNVDTVETQEDIGACAVPCKRSADGEDGPPRPSCRMRLTFP